MNKNNPKNENSFPKMTSAFLMIKAIGQTSITFLNRKKVEKDLRSYLDIFKNPNANATGEDLALFCDFYINSCLHSKQYGTTFFGTIPMSDEGVAKRIASDIDEVTRIIPHSLGLEDNFLFLRKALFASYKANIENADLLLSELEITI